MSEKRRDSKNRVLRSNRCVETAKRWKSVADRLWKEHLEEVEAKEKEREAEAV